MKMNYEKKDNLENLKEKIYNSIIHIINICNDYFISTIDSEYKKRKGLNDSYLNIIENCKKCLSFSQQLNKIIHIEGIKYILKNYI